jgi:hypothetical protein
VSACVGVKVTFVLCSKAIRAGGSVRVDACEKIRTGISRNRYIRDGYGCDGF